MNNNILNINQLEDFLLARIFAKLSVRDVLRIELVCRRWREVLILAGERMRRLAILAREPPPPPPSPSSPVNQSLGTLRARFNFNRLQAQQQNVNNPPKPKLSPLTVLKLAHNRFGVDFAPNPDRLKVTELTEEHGRFLAARFPNITELEIVENQLEPVVDAIVSLILAYQFTLTKLKVVIVGEEDANSAEAWNLLAQSINMFAHNLRYLTLYDHHQGCPAVTQLTNIFGVEQFNFGGFRVATPSQAFHIVRSDNFPLIRQLTLCGFRCTNDDIQAGTIFPLQSGQIEKLVYYPDRLGLEGNTEQADPLESHIDNCFLLLLAQNFTCLVSLQLGPIVPEVGMYLIANRLVSLISLRDLRLSYSVAMFSADGIPFWTASGEPKLYSVSKLQLDCDVIPHAEFEAIDKLFPNLTEIVIEGYDKCCRHLAEKYYSLIGTECYPSKNDFDIAAKKSVNPEDNSEDELLLKKCEDHFIERPVLRRMTRLREVCLGRHSRNAKMLDDKTPLLQQYRVANFMDGRKLMGSVKKFVSL